MIRRSINASGKPRNNADSRKAAAYADGGAVGVRTSPDSTLAKSSPVAAPKSVAVSPSGGAARAFTSLASRERGVGKQRRIDDHRSRSAFHAPCERRPAAVGGMRPKQTSRTHPSARAARIAHP